MAQTVARRKHLEEKEAFHNAVLSVPCFISSTPTKTLALSKQLPPSHSLTHQKIYYNGSRFVKTFIYCFSTLVEARQCYESSQASLVKASGGKEWAEYCKDISHLEGVLFQEGKVFVPWLENKEVRDLVNEIAQLIVYHGLFMEEHMRRTPFPLFRFLQHNTISLEYVYLRWRVYSYLQNDGEKRYRSEPFKIVEKGAEWVPPLPATIQRGVLNHKQRKYFSQLLGRLSRKKQDIEEAMVFAISCLQCAVEVVSIIAIEMLEKISEDSVMPHFLLISDILFNTTTPDYRRLFSRMLPFAIYQLRESAGGKDKEERRNRLRSELKSLIQLWEIKFIFDENYTRGLLFLLASENVGSSVKGLHERLKVIGDLEDQEESDFELERLCFTNGIPLLQSNKEASTRLINEYLWLHSKVEQRPPEINQNCDGEPITQKDLFKIKNKQVKVVTCEGLSANILLEKSWQTKGRISSSVDLQ